MGGGQLEKGPSPLNLRMLKELLRFYPSQDDANYFQVGFEEEFGIPAEGPRRAFFVGNLKSMQGLEHIAHDKIAKEVREG